MTLLDAPHPPKTMALPELNAPLAEDIVTALELAGCVVAKDLMPATELDQVRAELEPWFEQASCGEGKFFGTQTKRFSGVFAKAPATAALALCPPVLEAVETLLLGDRQAPHGDCIQLSQTQAIEIGPGEPHQLLHRDDSVFPIELPFEVIVNVMWPIDAFTAENGATRLAPGSHLWTRQLNEQYEDGVVSAVASPGSAVIWLGSLIHGGGPNRSAARRRGTVMSYSLAWLAPAEKLLLSTPPNIAKHLPERLQRLIGYQVHRPNLGWVEGCDPRQWLMGEIGSLASARDNFTPFQEEMLRQYFSAIGR